ncbi:hypothetical protein PAPYR_544 [Paratrimastix pyriformis]|uniref:Uncharacterized protein n=1 Tax=Paratrimastix pyriformis TaxID=342808 RepID=A0ABQ8UTV9_9EUKA|nr:hypothetical protein PAPYR_544 [Paratrimastix pyriformis]
MDKALPIIGLSQRNCQACGREDCPLAEKLAHCRDQAHLQHFFRAHQLFDGNEIVPCDIDPQFQHLCVRCCCGVEAGKTAEHLASADHAAQRALACLAPVIPVDLVNVAKQGLRLTDHVPDDLTASTTVTAAKGPWECLPCDLLLAIVEASPCPLHAYLSLLSLSHATRTAIRGTLRELSFAAFGAALAHITPTLATDALAAIIGPCKSLLKLTLPLDPEMAGPKAAPGWVDEAFQGHTQLAALTIVYRKDMVRTAPLDAAIERILSHLPGLVELTDHWVMSTRLLTALARSCPGLQVLSCPLSSDSATNINALAPLSGTLKGLEIFDSCHPPTESLAALVPTLSAVTSLKLSCRCPPAALEPIASHLTSLGLGDLGEEKDVPGPRLCHLETLSLSLRSDRVWPPLVRLLAANQATLRSLKMTPCPSFTEVASLMAVLRTLPHLTQLDLGSRSLADLPPDLVDRLERLTFHRSDLCQHPHMHITSSHLQRLCITGGHASGLSLHCPVLVDLLLNETVPTSLKCPRLRTFTGVAQGLTEVAPMPDLAEVHICWRHFDDYPAWLLPGSSPRLRVLSGACLSRPDLLARLCACGSLVRLEELHLDATRLPNPLVLRLPGQLEQLDLHIEGSFFSGGGEDCPVDLQVEAPGLLHFSLSIPEEANLSSVQVRLPNCPRLNFLVLESSQPILTLDEDEVGARTQPRYLRAAGQIDPASLLGLLTRHGSRLREVATDGLEAMQSEDWPKLMQALSGLPRLTDLTMDVSEAPSPLSVACPQLQRLILDQLPSHVKVVLACPLLEELRACDARRSQLQFALPAPNLDPQALLELATKRKNAERDTDSISFLISPSIHYSDDGYLSYFCFLLKKSSPSRTIELEEALKLPSYLQLVSVSGSSLTPDEIRAVEQHVLRKTLQKKEELEEKYRKFEDVLNTRGILDPAANHARAQSMFHVELKRSLNLDRFVSEAVAELKKKKDGAPITQAKVTDKHAIERMLADVAELSGCYPGVMWDATALASTRHPLAASPRSAPSSSFTPCKFACINVIRKRLEKGDYEGAGRLLIGPVGLLIIILFVAFSLAGMHGGGLRAATPATRPASQGLEQKKAHPTHHHRSKRAAIYDDPEHPGALAASAKIRARTVENVRSRHRQLEGLSGPEVSPSHLAGGLAALKLGPDADAPAPPRLRLAAIAGS